jgi:small GTP-binding protein
MTGVERKVIDNKPEDQRKPVKIILLGDSAVGKSKLVERFLMQRYVPIQMSTFALTLFHYDVVIGKEEVDVDFWDTAGQERFATMHPAYYHQAHACILVFDVTRKPTYKNLEKWLTELRSFREHIPCIVACNKIDTDPEVVNKSFAFADKHGLPLHYVSAADGTNVVSLFEAAIDLAVTYKKNPPKEDFVADVLDLLNEDKKKPVEAKKKDEAPAKPTASPSDEKKGD